MSLTGNLEDLPLLDIIQIVSFSKKTGTLSLVTAEGEAGLVFHEGLIVCAFAAGTAPLDHRFAALPAVQRDALIRGRIAIALEQLIRVREGEFSFSLADAPPDRLGERDLAPETLTAGINPQELLLDLARGIDEDRRDSAAAVEASFSVPEELPPAADDAYATPADEFPVPEGPPPPAPEPAPPTRPAGHDADVAGADLRDTPPAGVALPPGFPSTIPVPAVRPAASQPPAVAGSPAGGAPALPAESVGTVLLVDDEDDVRRVLSGWLHKGGYQVVEAEDPESAVKAGGRLAKEGTRFVLVTDLGMPTSGGSSFQGGFEVVKRLWKKNLRPQVLMMTDHLSQSLQLRARQMGINAFVFKPGLSKLNPGQFEADLEAFAGKLMADVLPRLARAAPAEPTARKAAPTAPREGSPLVASEEELGREFSFLQRRLAELRQPGNANQIAVLVVQVAREFFERGILFLVKNEEARGLGGFGLAPRGESLNLLVRQVALPLSEPSTLLDVVQRGKPTTGPLPPDRWSSHLIGRIGRFQAHTMALLPLVTHRETVAVLYGDSPETGREFPRLAALEVFVYQAGIALENAFLQRKLQSLQDRG